MHPLLTPLYHQLQLITPECKISWKNDSIFNEESQVRFLSLVHVYSLCCQRIVPMLLTLFDIQTVLPFAIAQHTILLIRKQTEQFRRYHFILPIEVSLGIVVDWILKIFFSFVVRNDVIFSFIPISLNLLSNSLKLLKLPYFKWKKTSSYSTKTPEYRQYQKHQHAVINYLIFWKLLNGI